MFNFKLLRIISISLLALTVSCGYSRPTETTKLKMSDQKLNDNIRRYLSIYDDIDQKVVSEFVRIVHENADIFNYLIESNIDPEFLPYLEKYSDLKMKYKNQPVDADVKILFGSHPLKTSDHLKVIRYSGYCDFFSGVVFIDRGFWDVHKDNERVRESVLFHELGHCDLNRKHFLLHEKFSFYVQIENFSFMNGDIVYSLLFDLLDQSRFESNGDYNLYSRHIGDTKEDLDQTFTLMYQELFSKENTRDNIVCRFNGECEEISQYQTAYDFETRNIVALKHLTIGPKQGDNLQDIMDHLRLQYVCYAYSNDNDELLNEYLEEHNQMTEEEVIEYCQLHFNYQQPS